MIEDAAAQQSLIDEVGKSLLPLQKENGLSELDGPFFHFICRALQKVFAWL